MARQETAGVDFSATKPTPGALREVGFRFVAGYLKPLWADGTVNDYELHPADLAGYHAAGLGVLMVYESTGDTWHGGAAAGADDARTAAARAEAVGYPQGEPIFAAVDQDPGGDVGTAAAYLAGFMDTINAAGWLGGGYGSAAVVDALAAARPSALLWQTAGWSGGVLSQNAHLYQRNVKYWPDVAGTDEDIVCRPMPCYGGTLVPGGAPIAPTPSPVPAPGPPPAPGLDLVAWVSSWTANLGDEGHVFLLLQLWGNGTFPLYCHIAPTAERYGPQTAGFLVAFAHRAAADPNLPGWVRDRLSAADGQNVGAGLAYALAHYGFPAYLAAQGWRP